MPMNASQLVNGDNMTELISLLTNTCLNLVRLVSTSSQTSVLPQSSYFIEYKSKMMRTVCEAIDRVVLNLETLLARNLAQHKQMGDPVGLTQPETPYVDKLRSLLDQSLNLQSEARAGIARLESQARIASLVNHQSQQTGLPQHTFPNAGLPAAGSLAPTVSRIGHQVDLLLHNQLEPATDIPLTGKEPPRVSLSE